MAALRQERGLVARPLYIWGTALVLVLVLVSSGRVGGGESGDEKATVLGRSLYATHCARCHGKNLEGQPDWQTRLPSGRLPAPPHDASGHSWHHPDHVLTGITRHGLKPYAGADYESDMPAFATVLSDQDIAAIIAFIKSTWPDRQREYQERMTAQAKPSESD
jgi:mono/diheme cytochrome c family protein